MKLFINPFFIIVLFLNVSCKKEEISPVLTSFPANYSYSQIELVESKTYIKTQSGFDVITPVGSFISISDIFSASLAQAFPYTLPFDSVSFATANIAKLHKGSGTAISAPYKQNGNEITIGEGTIGSPVNSGFRFLMDADLNAMKRIVYISVGKKGSTSPTTPPVPVTIDIYAQEFTPNIVNFRNQVAQQINYSVGDTIAVGVYQAVFESQ